ncbi:MAG: aldehyde dehydrogenase family protein, partial [Planctomycetes bacterium]|nr:aldehyde dehydrogenase family protein [Planctomycetota bacterium]
GAAAVMDVCGRSIIFGGADTVKRYAHDPRVEVHGPGWSKVVLGEDVIDDWERHLDVIVDSIAANSGRSCINASAVIVPRHGDAITEAVAQRLAAIEPTALDDPDAQLSAIANPAIAQWADGQIINGLRTPGARDVTAAARGNAKTERLVTFDGRTYLLPTLIRCDDASHPLANVEFMFPFASVLEVARDALLTTIGEALVVTAITEDDALINALLACPTIHRLNLGPMPTSVAQWDQPHEGNLFELLYQRRAIQRAVAHERQLATDKHG